MEPDKKRRYILREYRMVAILLRNIFKIPNDEMILDIVWNKSTNKLEINTIKDFDSLKGDV